MKAENFIVKSSRFRQRRISCLFFILAMVTAFFLFSITGVKAELPDTPNPNTSVTDGDVYAITTSGSTVYIGGKFSYVGPSNTTCGAALSASTGSPIPPYLKANGPINAVVSDGSGGWYIGGSFTRIGGTVRRGLAHILSDGVLDPTWTPGITDNADTQVYALALNAGILYVGGDFIEINYQWRPGIAALNAATGSLTSWTPDVFISDFVEGIAVSGGIVYVWGSFAGTGCGERRSVAAIDATTGLFTSWDPNPDGPVYALAVSDGIVYAGGWFTNIGGQPRNSIAAIDAATGLATSWNPNADYWVNALAVTGGVIYVGGFFSNIGGQPRNYLAAIDASTGLATSWNPNASGSRYTNDEVLALTLSEGIVYAGGYFTSIGDQPRKRIAAFDIATGSLTPWSPHANGPVFALAVSEGVVYAGGRFTSTGGQLRNNIAAIDGPTGMATSWNPNANGFIASEVRTLAVSGGVVYAGGNFWNIGGQPRNHLAAIDATTGLATSWNPNPDGPVYALAVSGGVVYVGGGFYSIFEQPNIGGQPRNYLAAIDATTGLATSWDPNSDGPVYALAISGGVVYVGGEFNSIGVQPRENIAAIDAATGLATSWNPNADYWVNALAVTGGVIYVGGFFSNIGGQPRPFVAAIDAVTGLATSWDPGVNSWANALAVKEGTIYVGGWFSKAGGQTRNYIAAIDTTTGLATSWNPDPDGTAYALAVDDAGSVYAGGIFSTLNGGETLQFYFAHFDPSLTESVSTPDAPIGPTDGSPGISYIYSASGSSSNFGHPVQYRFDWGDGMKSEWLPVGTTSAPKKWSLPGIYSVKVQARCSQHTSILSSWSPPLDVTLKKVTLLAPTSGEKLASGSTYKVEWDAPSQAEKFKLKYSMDNGVTWKSMHTVPYVTGSSYDWTVPVPMNNKKKCLAKVIGYDSAGVRIGGDKSDAPFTIEVVKVTYPNGGELLTSGDIPTITWTTHETKKDVARVILKYTKNDGNTWKKIATLDGNPGSYDGWTVPDVPKTKSKCKVKVVLKDARGNTVGSDTSDSSFTIEPAP